MAPIKSKNYPKLIKGFIHAEIVGVEPLDDRLFKLILSTEGKNGKLKYIIPLEKASNGKPTLVTVLLWKLGSLAATPDYMKAFESLIGSRVSFKMVKGARKTGLTQIDFSTIKPLATFQHGLESL